MQTAAEVSAIVEIYNSDILHAIFYLLVVNNGTVIYSNFFNIINLSILQHGFPKYYDMLEGPQ